MKNERTIIALLYLVFAPILCFSYNSNFGNKLFFFGNKIIGPKWNLHHEVQSHPNKDFGDIEQLLSRTGVGYNYTENIHLLLGHGFISGQNFVKGKGQKLGFKEHIIFQIFINQRPTSSTKLQPIFRCDQSCPDDLGFSLRYRYFLSNNIALNTPDIISNTWYASFYNEISINVEQNMFDRNRLNFGNGYKLNKAAKFDVVYMNQFPNSSNGDQLNLITF